MAKPEKPQGNLFAAMEDDLKQFWSAFSRALSAAPSAIAHRVGLITKATSRNSQEKIQKP
jgi:hypothetical protein